MSIASIHVYKKCDGIIDLLGVVTEKCNKINGRIINVQYNLDTCNSAIITYEEGHKETMTKKIISLNGSKAKYKYKKSYTEFNTKNSNNVLKNTLEANISGVKKSIFDKGYGATSLVIYAMLECLTIEDTNLLKDSYDAIADKCIAYAEKQDGLEFIISIINTLR